MAFEVFDKRMAPLSQVPSVTIQKRGIVSMNQAAHKLIEEAATVELLFDREASIVALRPSDESHAYKFRQQSRSGTGQVVLSATAFTQHYDIDTTVSRRYKPYVLDGMLCIDLNGPSTTVSGNRAKREGPADSQEPDTE